MLVVLKIQKLSWTALPIQIQKKEKLLDIIFDDKLKFQYHIENLRKKVSLILGALPRVAFCRSTTKEDFKQYLFSLTV